MAVTNIRSLKPHHNNLIENLKENQIDLAIVTELWEKDEDDELPELNNVAFEIETIIVQSMSEW